MTQRAGIYRIDTKDKMVHPIVETDLARHGLRERYDLQEWVEKHPAILGEELLIIAKEFSFFDGTNERVDLVALDQEGNTVIIELKRDDSGADVHWQAIKYASYFSRADTQSILDIYSKRFENNSIEAARNDIVSFMNRPDPDFPVLNARQRIILVSHRFAREVTSAVLWLRDKHGVDITCVELIPFSDSGSFYLQSRTIIPVPGTERFVITPGRPTIEGQSNKSYVNANDEITRFMVSVADSALLKLDGVPAPDRRNRWAGTWKNLRYYKLWYSFEPWSNHEFSYQTHSISNADGVNQYGIKFEIHKQHALSKGLTSDDIKELKALMEDYSRDKGCVFVEDDNGMHTEHFIPVVGLNDELRGIAANTLAGMIKFFTPRVEEILDKSNEQAT